MMDLNTTKWRFRRVCNYFWNRKGYLKMKGHLRCISWLAMNVSPDSRTEIIPFSDCELNLGAGHQLNL